MSAPSELRQPRCSSNTLDGQSNARHFCVKDPGHSSDHACWCGHVWVSSDGMGSTVDARSER